MRILIVDDEPSILELLKAFLEADNLHEVATARSGAEALSLLDSAECDFECLLLDIQMPGMNGITLCEKVRALPDYVRVPIIMVTAMSQKPYIDKAFSVGATDYVTKPFDFLELRGRLTAAAKIVDEYSRSIAGAYKAERLNSDPSGGTKPHPDEPLSIDGVERVLGYTALENYLFTLSRTKLLFASTYAVVIEDFLALHKAASAREMRSILKETAQVITHCSPNASNLVSYRGNGIFLCINMTKTSISPSKRMLEINSELARCPKTRPGIDEIRVSVGQEISLGSFSRAGAIAALRKAIDTLEHRPLPIKEMATLSRRALSGGSRTREQLNLERRAYAVILEEIIRDEGRRAG